MTALYNILKYNCILSIKQPDLHHVLAHNASIIDEGSIIRIDGTYIVDKNLISSVKIDENIIHIDYKNGQWIELFLASSPDQPREVPPQSEPPVKGFSKNGRKLGRPKGSKNSTL